jgi:hypothetical protein
MAKRRGRAISLDGLVARLAQLDKERISIQGRIASAIRALGVPSPFSPLLATSQRGRRVGKKRKAARKTRRRKMSAAGRKKISEAQKKRWATQKASKK